MRILIILTILIGSCAPSLYHVTTDTTFEQMENLPYKRKLIYLNKDIGTLSKLNSLATSMNKKKWKYFDESIKALPTGDQQFLKSIKYLISDEFLVSYNTLDSLEDSDYNCQVGLLKTDCLYELGADSVNFKGNYQNSMNCTGSEIIKSIINTRYRFLRYGQ